MYSKLRKWKNSHWNCTPIKLSKFIPYLNLTPPPPLIPCQTMSHNNLLCYLPPENDPVGGEIPDPKPFTRNVLKNPCLQQKIAQNIPAPLVRVLPQ